jgi:hypothetical protein
LAGCFLPDIIAKATGVGPIELELTLPPLREGNIGPMWKWLNPEIALGFLLATVLWTGVLAWQSSLMPTEGEKECIRAAAKSGYRPDECKSLLEKTFTDPVALFTLALTASTIGLWTATRRTAKLAEVALTELERPWLFLEATTIRRRELPGQSIQPNNWSIRLHWKNVGRAPAIIEECLFRISPKSSLPSSPIYAKESGLSCSATVSAGQVIETNEVGPGPGTDEILVFFGRLTYKELSGKIHETGYALEVSPHIAACSQHLGEKYSYYT